MISEFMAYIHPLIAFISELYQLKYLEKYCEIVFVMVSDFYVPGQLTEYLCGLGTEIERYHEDFDIKDLSG